VKLLSEGLISRESDFPLGWVGAVVQEIVPTTVKLEQGRFILGDENGYGFTSSSDTVTRNSENLANLSLDLLKVWTFLAEKNFVYSDFKAENLGLTNEPGVHIKLLDLDSGAKVSQTRGAKSGLYYTSGFESPELSRKAAGKSRPGEYIDHYSDLYSMGKTLLQTACNSCSLEGFSAIIADLAKKLPPDENGRLALARLIFIRDILAASLADTPKERDTWLKNGPLRQVLSLEEGPDGEKPKLVADLAKVDALYLPRVSFKDGHPFVSLPEARRADENSFLHFARMCIMTMAGKQ